MVLARSIAAVPIAIRYAGCMSMTALLIVLCGGIGLCAVLALLQAGRARRAWRNRHRVSATFRLLWSAIFLLLALLGTLGGSALIGWQRLTSEALVARVDTQLLGPQRYAVTIETADGSRHSTELTGDDWQLDAHVIKWHPRAVMLGAPPLYRLDRISGRYRDLAQEREAPRSVVGLSSASALDLWQLKKQFPRWMPWVDADYGSAAYLPLLDDGHFTVTLAAAGGLVARPTDAATAEKIH